MVIYLCSVRKTTHHFLCVPLCLLYFFFGVRFRILLILIKKLQCGYSGATAMITAANIALSLAFPLRNPDWIVKCNTQSWHHLPHTFTIYTTLRIATNIFRLNFEALNSLASSKKSIVRQRPLPPTSRPLPFFICEFFMLLSCYKYSSSQYIDDDDKHQLNCAKDSVCVCLFARAFRIQSFLIPFRSNEWCNEWRRYRFSYYTVLHFYSTIVRSHLEEATRVQNLHFIFTEMRTIYPYEK